MKRLFACLVLMTAALAVRADYPPVLPGAALEFPRDFGAHPAYRTEWWYATGWLEDEGGVERGFQVTFFRVRPRVNEDSASRFAPRQLVLAHAAVADVDEGRLLHAERSARALAPLAGAEEGDTRAWVGDWLLEREDGGYRTSVSAGDFAFDLDLVPDRVPVLNGRSGYSQKAPDPLNASYYYSRPQLAVAGELTIRGETQRVRGQAWLDHEWSSEILPEGARGWDWIGINLADGGSLMAFQMRDAEGDALWGAATLAGPDREARTFGSDEIEFVPRRRWRSPRTGAEYVVEWDVRVGQRRFSLVPLMDDQELDARASTGAIYWEGAVLMLEDGREAGRGYLEMTGVRERLRM